MRYTKTQAIWIVAIAVVLIVSTVGYVLYRKARQPIAATSTPVVLANFDDCKAHNYPVIQTYPEQCTGPDGTIYVQDFSEAASSTEADASSGSLAATATSSAISYKDLIQVTDLQKNELITSPLHIEGQARGQFYFEAIFPIKIEDSKGDVLGSAPAQAESGWATTSYVAFAADVTFTKPQAASSTGFVVLSNDNPSGDPAKAVSLKIPVRF